MRNFATAVGIAATLLCTGASHAQSPASNYPTKPVTLIAPFPPGTTTEFSAREISQILGQTHSGGNRQSLAESAFCGR